MKKNKTKKTTRKTIQRLCLLHETARMESVWPGLPTHYFLRDSLWKFLGGVFLGRAVCRNFWAVFFFCFFLLFFFSIFFEKKTNKKQNKKTEKKGVTPGPRSPGPPATQPPLTLHWRNLVPVETILCDIQVYAVFCCALFFPFVLPCFSICFYFHFVFSICFYVHLVFPFVFIFILFFLICFFCVFFCFFSIFFEFPVS